MGKKIATCSYCGTRAVLVLDAQRHELTCSACGAPLHDMKFMPQNPEKPAKSKPAGKSAPKPHSKPKDRAPAAAGIGLAGHAAALLRDKKKRKSKKRKPMFRRVLEEIWDEVENIFD